MQHSHFAIRCGYTETLCKCISGSVILLFEYTSENPVGTAVYALCLSFILLL